MSREELRGSVGLARLLAIAIASAGLAGCAMSERGPDANAFVQQVRQLLGDAGQRDVPVSQLLATRWQQLCMHREGSLSLSLIEKDQRHVVRVPFRQLSVGETGSVDSLDGQCLQRDQTVRLRRHGSGSDAPIMLERAADAGADAALIAQQ